MLVCGVDESGRGCVMGSLIICAVVFDETVLANIPVADSKKLSKKRREKLHDEILEAAHEVIIVELTATDINNYHRQGLTLNQMEVIGFTKALNDLEIVPDEIYLDAADVIESRFGANVSRGYVHVDNVEITSKHKADANFPVVGAASIIAKVTRDAIMASITPTVSGYGDPKTMQWLREYHLAHGNFPKDCRYFWKTLDTVKASLREDD